MIGMTLSLYFGKKFAKTFLGMMLALAFLIVTVDFIEQLRKVTENIDAGIGDLYMVSLLRAPLFLEKAIPFGCLFAAMITLAQLNQKMELVVARAAGVSAWKFLFPISAVALGVGILVSTVYNPLSVVAFEHADQLSAKIFSGGKVRSNISRRDLWLKQEMDGESTIIHAANAHDSGAKLQDVRILVFNKDHKIQKTIQAQSGEFLGDHWLFKHVTESHSGGNAIKKPSMELDTNLTRGSLLGAAKAPENVGFWNLLHVAQQVENSGSNPRPFLVQYYGLMLLPLFLVSMVLIAATVSLRFVRFGQSARMIMGGILSGFVLYTLAKLVVSLGSNAVISPVAAAWAPSVVAILLGISVLLHQEDG